MFEQFIKRVTAGAGGDPLLILGSEKTLLYDAGMAYCGQEMVENVKRELQGRTLDFVLLSHTHYDHIGGLAYIKAAYPGAVVLGSAVGMPILQKEKALALIRKLSQAASDKFLGENSKPLDYDDRFFRMDIGLGDGDLISLGDKHIRCFVTKGHTNCSMAYYLEEDSILLASESTGIYEEPGYIKSSILSNYAEAMKSIEKCRAIGAKYIYSPHAWPEVDPETTVRYWDLTKQDAETMKDFILEKKAAGMDDQAILEACTDLCYKGRALATSTREAFMVNLKAKVHVILKEFAE